MSLFVQTMENNREMKKTVPFYTFPLLKNHQGVGLGVRGLNPVAHRQPLTRGCQKNNNKKFPAGVLLKKKNRKVYLKKTTCRNFL